MARAVPPKVLGIGTSIAWTSHVWRTTSAAPIQERAVCVKPGTRTTRGRGTIAFSRVRHGHDGPRRKYFVRGNAGRRMGTLGSDRRGGGARLPLHAARAGTRPRRTAAGAGGARRAFGRVSRAGAR